MLECIKGMYKGKKQVAVCVLEKFILGLKGILLKT